jgi:hypothetical protein
VENFLRNLRGSFSEQRCIFVLRGGVSCASVSVI